MVYGFWSDCKCKLFVICPFLSHYFAGRPRNSLIGANSLWTHTRAQAGRATIVGASCLDASGGLDFRVPGGGHCVNYVFKI